MLSKRDALEERLLKGEPPIRVSQAFVDSMGTPQNTRANGRESLAKITDTLLIDADRLQDGVKNVESAARTVLAHTEDLVDVQETLRGIKERMARLFYGGSLEKEFSREQEQWIEILKPYITRSAIAEERDLPTFASIGEIMVIRGSLNMNGENILTELPPLSISGSADFQNCGALREFPVFFRVEGDIDVRGCSLFVKFQAFLKKMNNLIEGKVLYW